MWLDGIVLAEAILTLASASVNGAFLARVAASAKTRSRRLAASALALICSGLGLEALLFLYLETQSATAGAPVLLLVRGVLLASSGLLTALILRSTARR